MHALALVSVCGYEEGSDSHGHGVLITISFLVSAARLSPAGILG